MARICSIEGCNKRHYARGWCEAHYTRWRKYDDPLGGSTAWGEPAKFYRETVLTCERGPDDDCLIWPFTRGGRGYAQMWVDGHLQIVSRLICREVHGDPPTPEHQAAHSCGRGDHGCVTKGHLSWKTVADNHADTLIHGTRTRGERNGSAKLTEVEARAILALKGKYPRQFIAEYFEVAPQTVSQIHSRASWAWL